MKIHAKFGLRLDLNGGASVPASRKLNFSTSDGSPVVLPRQNRSRSKSQRAFWMLDLTVALVILTMAIIPLGFSFAQEQRAFRADYCRAVVNEIVDGEMEILAAGDWKNFPDGRQTYIIHCRAAANLPPGHFELTKNGHHLRLEWLPEGRNTAAVREITVP